MRYCSCQKRKQYNITHCSIPIAPLKMELRVLGDFTTSAPYMAFAENLQENTIKGTLLVSTFGGGTCNTEFEFLTGMTMKFLPPGSASSDARINEKYSAAPG